MFEGRSTWLYALVGRVLTSPSMSKTISSVLGLTLSQGHVHSMTSRAGRLRVEKAGGDVLLTKKPGLVLPFFSEFCARCSEDAGA